MKSKKGTRFVFLKKRGGEWRRTWFGRWMANGVRRETSLCAWHGTPPEKPGTQEGDAAFERSRERALKMLAEAIGGDTTAKEELHDRQVIHALLYKKKVERLKVADLAERWETLPHEADARPERRARVRFVLERFASFIRQNFPNIRDVGALAPEHFKAFFDDVDADGVTARTWNDYLSILRGVLAKVGGYSLGFSEYLARLKRRTGLVVHRRPFDAAELDTILAAAAEVDPELRPVIVAAVCTALRRGDVCRLRWRDVDLAEGFLKVKTSKTGDVVEIPILPPLQVVLEDANKSRKRGVPYVWPAVAVAYGRNPDSLNRRLQAVLAAAGFVRPEKVADGGCYDAPEDAEAAAAMLEDGMEREGWTAKRKAKARQVLALHFEGKNGKQIAEALEISKGAVSDYLHAMEDAGRMALVSAPRLAVEKSVATLAEIQDGEQRKNRGSLCGWHSFRTTFCTLALAAGIPMDLLRTITGHRTAEIVLKHYNRPRREQIRQMMGKALALPGASSSGDLRGEVADALAAATPEQLAAALAALKRPAK